MAVSMRAKVSAGVAQRNAPKARVVVCQAHGENASMVKLQIAAAALATAALFSQPAHAGVVLAQPELKKVFQADATPAPVKERPFRVPGSAPAAAPAEAKAEAPKKEKAEESGVSEGIDPRAIALPASIVAIAGLGLAASKVDEGFNEWINESGALVRKSDNYAGFEEDIKGPGYLAAGNGKVGTSKVGASKKVAVKGTTKTTTKKIGTSFFGKKN